MQINDATTVQPYCTSESNKADSSGNTKSSEPLDAAELLDAQLGALRRLLDDYRAALDGLDHGTRRDQQLAACEQVIGEWRERNRRVLPEMVEHLRRVRVPRVSAVVIGDRSYKSAVAWLVKLGEHACRWILCNDRYLDQLDAVARWLADELRVDRERLFAEVEIELEQVQTINSRNPKLDARVRDLLQELQSSSSAACSELPELSPVLSVLASFLAVYSQEGGFRATDKVPEKEFQRQVVRFMRTNLGAEVQEHGHQAGGITDMRYRGVIVELKVEKDTNDRDAICRKYTAQPTQYAGSEARQVSVLLVLDLTEKVLPPADIRNDIRLVDVPTHGGADSSKPHPSKAFVFVLNGNLRSPSSYS